MNGTNGKGARRMVRLGGCGEGRGRRKEGGETMGEALDYELTRYGIR